VGGQTGLGAGGKRIGEVGTFNEGVELATGHDAAVDGGDFAVGVDEDGGGQGAGQAVIGGCAAAFVEGGGEGEAEFVEEGADILGAFVLVESQNDQAVILVFLPDGLDLRHLQAARTAPGGPEVDQDGPADELAEGDGFTVDALKAEFVGLVADLERGAVTGKLDGRDLGLGLGQNRLAGSGLGQGWSLVAK
jgi:hypothetical protein